MSKKGNTAKLSQKDSSKMNTQISSRHSSRESNSSSSESSESSEVDETVLTENQLTLDDLKKVQFTRKLLAQNLESAFFKEMVSNTLIKFSTNTGKYILGIISSTSKCEVPYVVTYQEVIKFDKEKQLPVVRNCKADCEIELVVKLGDIGIFSQPRRVRVSHVSNQVPSLDEIRKFKLNF